MMIIMILAMMARMISLILSYIIISLSTLVQIDMQYPKIGTANLFQYTPKKSSSCSICVIPSGDVIYFQAAGVLLPSCSMLLF